jgi:hypothetical protein
MRLEELAMHLRDEMASVPEAPERLQEVTEMGNRRRRGRWLAAAAAVVVVTGLGVAVGNVLQPRGGIGVADQANGRLEVVPGVAVEVDESLGEIETINGRLEIWSGRQAPPAAGDLDLAGAEQLLAEGAPHISDDGLPFSDSPIIYLGEASSGSVFLHGRHASGWDRFKAIFGEQTTTDIVCVHSDLQGGCFIPNSDVTGGVFGEGELGESLVAVSIGLPSETAVVTVTTDTGEAHWQRPVSGTAWIELGDQSANRVSITALDRFGAEISTHEFTLGPVQGTTTTLGA